MRLVLGTPHFQRLPQNLAEMRTHWPFQHIHQAVKTFKQITRQQSESVIASSHKHRPQRLSWKCQSLITCSDSKMKVVFRTGCLEQGGEGCIPKNWVLHKIWIGLIINSMDHLAFRTWIIKGMIIWLDFGVVNHLKHEIFNR